MPRDPAGIGNGFAGIWLRMQAWLRWAGMAIVVALRTGGRIGGGAPKQPQARAAPSYEERVRQVLDRYVREATPVREGPEIVAQLSRRVATLKRASDGLAEITPPRAARRSHRSAQAFLREADILGRFLYDLQRQHLPWKRAMGGSVVG